MEKTLEEIQKDLEEKAQVVEESTFLFLDISSTCVGYAIASINFKNRHVNVKSAGGIWLPNLPHEEKYNYMFAAILNYFDIVQKIDYCIYEMYNVNPKRMAGVMVCPEMIGSIRCAMAEAGIKHSSFLPQQWRSALKIKRNINKDYKAPTKERVLEYVAVPEQVVSNVTNKLRSTPSDVYDALGICFGWLLKNGFTKIASDNVKFQEHVGVV